MDLSKLNEGQRKAVTTISGYVRCTASAGSGKTHALTHRVAYMLEQGISPEKILCFTFTKKAGEEMKERISKMLGEDVSEQVTIGTIHSVFLKVLRPNITKVKPFNRFGILTGYKQKKLIKEVFEDIVGTKNMYKNPGMALANISRAKNELLSPEALMHFLTISEEKHKFWVADCYRVYESRKDSDRVIDFDDMLYLTYRLFKSHPDVLEQWQKRWEYILVDEFQDTNTAQYEVIKMLSAGHGNLFIVGDEKQSIYGFRGARVDYIRNFASVFPSAKSITLELTYRCKSNIVEASNKLAQLMEAEEAKAFQEGGFINYLGHYGSEDEEAERVADEIEILLKDGLAPKDVKVLYRTNSQSRALEEALINKNIPYIVLGGGSFFDRKDVKDMLAYLSILDNPNDEYSYERIVNRPSRYLGKAFIREWKKRNAKGSKCFEALAMEYPKRAMEQGARTLYWQLKELFEKYRSGIHKNVGEIIQEIRAVTGYDDWLIKDEVTDDPEEIMQLLEGLNELVVFGQRFKEIKKFLDYVYLVQKKKDKDANKDAVQLMTIHKAKGSEAKAVFVTGVSQGLLPHGRGEIEEERRLMYVAVTRASDYLYLSGFAERMNQVLPPSQFLKEMEIEINEEMEEEYESQTA